MADCCGCGNEEGRDGSRVSGGALTLVDRSERVTGGNGGEMDTAALGGAGGGDCDRSVPKSVGWRARVGCVQVMASQARSSMSAVVDSFPWG